MADVELVIKIPEEEYAFCKKQWDTECSDTLMIAVKYGTPLPKGHGRLGDLDNIWNKLKEIEGYYQAEFLKKSNMIHESAMNGRLYGFTTSKFIVQDAPTIIEADEVKPLTNGDWHYGSEPMQNISYSDRTTIIEADKEYKDASSN